VSQPAVDGIATVTLNPALDLTAELAELLAGAVNRVTAAQQDPGGKGVNVAGFLADWQVRLAVTGFLGTENAQSFQRLLAAKGIADHFVAVDGPTRTNIKIVEQDGARITDLNFPGFHVSPEHEQALARTVDMLASRYEWVLFCGSLPEGVAPDVYAYLIARARAQGARVALDTSGAPLAAGLTAQPQVIKPNGKELSEVLGTPIETVAQAADAARVMRRRGIDSVIVSLGADGAVFADAHGVLHAVGQARTVRSTVGAGDALLAGFMLGTLRGLPPADRARLATGFSLGALTMLGPHLPPAATVESLAATVSVTPLAA